MAGNPVDHELVGEPGERRVDLPGREYLAYSDSTGIHLRAIDSGDTQTLAVREVTDINRVRWFPDGNKLLISGKETGERGRLGIWSLALIGSALKKLRTRVSRRWHRQMEGR